MIREDIYTGVLLIEVVPLEVFVQVFFTFKHSNDLVTMTNVFKTIREGGSMCWPISNVLPPIRNLQSLRS